MSKKKLKVIVAMSGGVDSSVAAALLKKQGFDVIGVFMKFWFSPAAVKAATNWNRCCSLEAEARARSVARVLDIPFYVFNFEKEFKKKVVDSFLKEYRAGHTPNPCVVCNKEIKFGLLLQKALALDADYIATGHYVNLKNGKLSRAKDENKDQSYFLWQLSQDQLKRVLFPLGNYEKPKVRKLAKAFKLPVAETPESQEICFVPGDINDFLKDYFKPKKGKIVDVDGKVLGEHQGLIFYTLGQRKGIGLSQGPYFVKKKDFKNNNLIVTKDERDLSSKELTATDVNWLSGKEPKLPSKIKTKIRYRAKLVPAVIHKLNTKNYKLVFSQPQRAITPGQSVVFYKGNEVLGGGIIK
jgi:tRNA-specific 2-thiouridylase